MSDTQEFLDQVDRYSAHNYHPLPVVLDRGEGCWVWDIEGKKYLDMLAAYSAVNQGHRHPRIIAALKDQADRLTLTSRAFHNDQMGPFLEELCTVTGFERALPMNTGAEAVETAIKAARKWGYTVKGVADDQAEIIVCSDNFHGRTTTIVGFSSEDDYRFGFGPFTPGFKIVEYGNADALEAAITPNTVGFLVEPLQGEAGVVVPPDGYFKQCLDICRQNNVLVINDEIQTGLGRTGRMFCGDWDGGRGDILRRKSARCGRRSRRAAGHHGRGARRTVRPARHLVHGPASRHGVAARRRGPGAWPHDRCRDKGRIGSGAAFL